uniref:Uncharacterized protein n=1 Tax=Anguilla anguilla TaxID=7936 RepID=A0A0E9QM80_ANGAN
MRAMQMTHRENTNKSTLLRMPVCSVMHAHSSCIHFCGRGVHYFADSHNNNDIIIIIITTTTLLLL